MMLDEARAVHEAYPQIQLWDTNIDAQMMWLTKNPEDYGVIVAGNMFGDIISDGFAGLVGGLGFAASANIGREVGVFEPTHGSAPKYADLDPSIVNPIAMVLSAVMMLDWLGETEIAERVRRRGGRSHSRGHGPHLRHAQAARRSGSRRPGCGDDNRDDRRHHRSVITLNVVER